MESLNYTQLASVVLALSVAFGLLLIICLHLIWRTIHIQNDFIKEDEAVYIEIYNCENKIKELNAKVDVIQKGNNYLEHKLDKLKNDLVKPKFSVGDKIVCSDGTRGIITDIEQVNGSFHYGYKTRKYFKTPGKQLRTSEYGILGLS